MVQVLLEEEQEKRNDEAPNLSRKISTHILLKRTKYNLRRKINTLITLNFSHPPNHRKSATLHWGEKEEKNRAAKYSY